VIVAPALGLRRLRRRDGAALLGLLLVAVAVHSIWWWPSVRHGPLAGAVPALRLASPWDVVRIFARPTSVLALAILGLGIAALGRWRRSDALAAWTVAATAAVWAIAATFGAWLGPLSRLECVRALVPLVLLAALPAGALLDRLARRVAPGTPALVSMLGLIVAFTLPPFASVLDSRFYYVHRLHAMLDPRFLEVAAAIDAAAPSDARVLFEATANARTPISNGIPLEALLPIHTRRELVGPPQPGIRYALPALEFGAGSLGGRAFVAWTKDDLAAYLERYDIGAAVAWSAHARAFLASCSPVLVQVGSVNGFEIYRSSRAWGRVARGEARVRTGYDRIEISDARGDEIVVKMHWTDDLRSTPQVQIERVALPGDSLGFVAVRPGGHARVLLGPGL
jgi:hypothetical protein